MGLETMRKRQQQGRKRQRKPMAASAMLRVVEVDKTAKTITVTLPGNTAAQINSDSTGPLELAIRPNAAFQRVQPTMLDLLGDPKRTIRTSMEVAPDSVIVADNLQMEDDKVSCSWVALGAGPAADREAGKRAGLDGPKHAEIAEGWLLARQRKVDVDGTTQDRIGCEMLCIEDAQQIPAGADADAQSQAITAALTAAGPGRGEAVVRLSDPRSGASMHEFVSLRDRDSGEKLSPEAAAALAVERIRSYGEDEDGPPPVMEVIPMRKIAIGGETQKQLFDAWRGDNKAEVNFGTRKYHTAEIYHPDRQQTPRNLKVQLPASEKQIALVESVAQRRSRAVPDTVKESSAAASAWLEQNLLRQGWAHGQVLTREQEGDNGELYHIAIGAALHRRGGVEINGIPTKGNPKAADFAREQGELAQSQRASLQRGVVHESLIETEERDPTTEPAPEMDPEAGYEDDAGPTF